MKVKVCLVGIGGYGTVYMKLLINNVPREDYDLVAVVDPYAEKSPYYSYVIENNIPVYDDLDEYLKTNKPDLVILSTPIHLHFKQTKSALDAGVNVLCEKPLTPILQDAYKMVEMAKQSGLVTALGFQRPFVEGSKQLKNDVMSGVFGKPVNLKAIATTPRFDDYYQKGWNGKVKDSDGNFILDSNLLNAASHYIHHTFWLLGDSLGTAKCPKNISFTTYRAKDIETFDTCDVKGTFDDGATFSFYATHSSDSMVWFDAEYTFEKATIYINKDDNSCKAVFNDGTVKLYDIPQHGDAATYVKITGTIDAIKNGAEIPSLFESEIPHLKMCNAIMDFGTIHTIPKEYTYRTKDPDGTLVKNLSDDIMKCYEQDKTFFELGLPWAKSPDFADLENYTEFSGQKYREV